MGMGWDWDGNAPTTGGGGDGRAIDGKPRTKEAIASKATSSRSPPPHRKRQRWSRDPEGQVWGLGTGHGVLDGGIHSRCRRLESRDSYTFTASSC